MYGYESFLRYIVKFKIQESFTVCWWLYEKVQK